MTSGSEKRSLPSPESHSVEEFDNVYPRRHERRQHQSRSATPIPDDVSEALKPKVDKAIRLCPPKVDKAIRLCPRQAIAWEK